MTPKSLIGIMLTVSFVALILCDAGLLVAHMEHGIHIAGCPFTGPMDASCPLSTVERLSTFAATLGVLPVALISFLLLLAYGIATASPDPKSRAATLHVRNRIRSDDAAMWHPLQFAFARGILNPKPF